MTAERPLTPLEKVQDAQSLLIAFATGGSLSDWDYQEMRKELLDSPAASLLPPFLRTCRSSQQFWAFIKTQFAKYKERREFLWEAFQPALEFLERGGITPPAATSNSPTCGQVKVPHLRGGGTRAS